MAGNVQPLVNNQRIVNPDGTPTDYFIRWAQTKQIDISGGITLDQLKEYLAGHQMQAGTGISITPSGDINDKPTIALNAALGDLNNVDLQTTAPTNGQVIAYDAASGLWLPVNQSGGGGGGAVMSWEKTPILPSAASFVALNTSDAGYYSFADSVGCIDITVKKDTTHSQWLNLWGVALSSSVFDITIRQEMAAMYSNYTACGIAIWNTVNNRGYSFRTDMRGQTPNLWSNRWSSFNGNAGTTYGTQQHPCIWPWLRIECDGTTMSCKISRDGRRWSKPVTTEALATYIGASPTHACIGLCSGDQANDVTNVNLISFEVNS